MKKIVTNLLLIFIALALCSCGDKPVQELPETPAPVENRVSFVGCGDNITYEGNIRDALSNATEGGRKYNFKPIFKNVEEKVRNADIAFINQETLMCGEGYEITHYPTFNSPQDLGYDLLEIGYDVVNIANNHMLDKGAKGLEKTIDFWKERDCLMIGGYENESDFDKIRTLEKNGIKFAFVSFTYDTNGIRLPKGSEMKIPYIDDEDIKEQIASAKEISDFVMVSIHWGEEGQFEQNAEQERVAQLIADCGADAIIGHHPHVIQPVEWLTGVGGNKTLCVYSLGNFAAEQAYQYNMVGGMIEFDIVKKGDEKAYIENPVYIPTVFHYYRDFSGNRIYYLTDYSRELANAHGVSNYFGHAFSYDTLFEYVDRTIPPEFLPEEYKN